MVKKVMVFATILSILLTSCSLRRVGGIVQGVVYADLNGDGTIEEPAETPLDGVEVTLADCGPTQTQITGMDGAFHFADLPEGTCHVSVAKPGWVYSGEYPLLSYPMPAASDPNLPTSFSMFMAPVSTTPTDTPVPVSTDTPVITDTPTSSVAMVTPNSEDVNCRFGASVDFLATGALRVGNTVPILGRLADNSWWQIQNPLAVGTRCWVSAAATHTSGDLTLVPIIASPSALVTDVAITTPSVIHGFCSGPNPTSFVASITTNGPTSVTYHLEIYNGSDDSLRNQTSDESRSFASASTQSFDPGGAYSTDCGDYYIKLVVTSPNAMTAQANWSVVEP